jgi:hypothetical protein
MNQIECSFRADLFAQSHRDCAIQPRVAPLRGTTLGTLAHDPVNPNGVVPSPFS